MMGMGSSTSLPDRSGIMTYGGPSVSIASMQHNRACHWAVDMKGPAQGIWGEQLIWYGT